MLIRAGRRRRLHLLTSRGPHENWCKATRISSVEKTYWIIESEVFVVDARALETSIELPNNLINTNREHNFSPH